MVARKMKIMDEKGSVDIQKMRAERAKDLGKLIWKL
jgi:hypothetical protein